MSIEIFKNRPLKLNSAGRSAARIARLAWDQEVGGSNPLAPIHFYNENIFDIFTFSKILYFL